MKVNKDFLIIIDDIINHPEFKKMKNIQHHGKHNNTYIHSYKTALFAYKSAKFFGFSRQDIVSTTRAACLHDFFCYDWRKNVYKQDLEKLKGIRKIKNLHCFIHPIIAANNANKHFNISDRQKNAIENHMFPLSFDIPKNKEAWIVTLSDKVIATEELFKSSIYLFKKKK